MKESSFSLDIYNRRLDIWLWLRLDELGREPTLYSFASPKIREYLKSDGAEFGSLLQESHQSLLPQEMLNWITEDRRQIHWMLQKLEGEFKISIKFCPPNLAGRDLVFAEIDICDKNFENKINLVGKLQEQWNEFVNKDVIFNWFLKKDESSRVAAAWDWLSKNRKEAVYGVAKFLNYQDVVNFYYLYGLGENDVEWEVSKIKKLWDSRNFRKKEKLKESNNFGLAGKSIQNLDKIRRNYKFSRVEMLNALIQFEVERGLYAKERSGT